MRDGYCPSTMGVNFWSSFSDKKTEHISKERALLLAADGAKAIMHWKPGADWLKNYSLGQATADLEIVNPNYLPDQPNMESLGASFNPAARLAWVVTYQKSYNGPKSSENASPIGGDIEVWIDAETGALLGGDLK